MPLMVCPKCTRFHYVPGECPAPKTGAMSAVTSDRIRPATRGQGPEDSRAKASKAKPAAARQPKPDSDASRLSDTAEVSQSAPVSAVSAALTRKDTRKGDRHKPGYQAEKQKIYRERRAKAKENKQ